MAKTPCQDSKPRPPLTPSSVAHTWSKTWSTMLASSGEIGEPCGVPAPTSETTPPPKPPNRCCQSTPRCRRRVPTPDPDWRPRGPPQGPGGPIISDRTQRNSPGRNQPQRPARARSSPNVITTRSATVGMPSGRNQPPLPGLGDCTRRNHNGQYLPARTPGGEITNKSPHPLDAPWSRSGSSLRRRRRAPYRMSRVPAPRSSAPHRRGGRASRQERQGKYRQVVACPSGPRGIDQPGHFPASCERPTVIMEFPTRSSQPPPAPAGALQSAGGSASGPTRRPPSAR